MPNHIVFTKGDMFVKKNLPTFVALRDKNGKSIRCIACYEIVLVTFSISCIIGSMNDFYVPVLVSGTTGYVSSFSLSSTSWFEKVSDV